MGQPLPAIVVLLFVLVGVYHMQIGMRSVIIDYLGAAPENGGSFQRLVRRRLGRRLRLRGAAHRHHLIEIREG